MMKIQLWSIGKAHDKYVEVGIKDFTQRIGRYFPVEWKIIPTVKNAPSLQENELKKAEAKLVIDKLDSNDVLILLDERGKNISSPNLASFIQQKADSGSRNLIFLIGGAFGVGQEVMDRAQMTWSISQLVFPHMLVRLILSEQIYRACTIIRGEKYHHL